MKGRTVTFVCPRVQFGVFCFVGCVMPLQAQPTENGATIPIGEDDMPAKLEVKMARAHAWKAGSAPWTDSASIEIPLQIPTKGAFSGQGTVTHQNNPTFPGASGSHWTCEAIAPKTSSLSIEGRREGPSLTIWARLSHPGLTVRCYGRDVPPPLTFDWLGAAIEVKLDFADGASQSVGPGMSPAGWINEYRLRLACPVSNRAGYWRVDIHPPNGERYPVNIGDELTTGELVELARRDLGDDVRGYTTVGKPWPPEISWKFDDDEGKDAKFGAGCCVMGEITISYPPIEVYVASEFAQNACAREAILEHEMLHYSDIAGLMQNGPNELKDALEAVAGSLPVFLKTNNCASAKGIVEEAVSQRIRAVGPARAEYLKKNKARSDALKNERDKPEAIRQLNNRVDECMRR